MSAQMDDALTVVRAAYGEEQWAALAPEEQTRALIREMRRLSLEHAARRRTPAAAAAVEGSERLQCSVLVKTRASDRCSWHPVVVLGGRPYCGLHDPRRWRPEVGLPPQPANESGMLGAAD